MSFDSDGFSEGLLLVRAEAGGAASATAGVEADDGVDFTLEV